MLCRSNAKIGDPEEECLTCAALIEQTEEAKMEWERVSELPESAKIERKWTHLHLAFLGHEFKAHNQDARGKEWPTGDNARL